MKIGTTLYLDLEEDKYRSRLVEKREGYLFIDLPIDLKTNRTSLLREGTTLRVSFSAGENTLYAFESVIRGRKLGRIPMLVLDYPGEDKFIRLQRREFVRITDSIDIAVHPKEERFPAFTTTTLDLSGGGTAIHLPKNHGLKEEMEVRCWIVLPMRLGDLNYLCLECKVVRIFQSGNEQNEKASLQFVSIEERQQQQVIRYCFDQELTQKKNGLAE